MAKRSKLTRGGSKALFRATATKTHRLNNFTLRVMRGGTRL
jgi:hypothetical protein